MDDTDRELLRLLHRDARSPAAELARSLGVSRSTVQNRIDRLLADGVIAGFTVAPGQGHSPALIQAVVMIKLATGDSRQVIAKLKAMDEVETLTAVNGDFDFHLDIQVSSLPRLDEVLARIRRLPSVADTNTSICLNRFK